jgi:hypothetical protein
LTITNTARSHDVLLLEEDHGAAKHDIAEQTAAIAQGLREKAEEFRKSGGEIYRRA